MRQPNIRGVFLFDGQSGSSNVDLGFVTSTNTAIDASSDWCWWLVVAISKIVSAQCVNSTKGISVVQCVGGNVVESRGSLKGFVASLIGNATARFFFSTASKDCVGCLENVISLLHALSTLKYK